MPNSMRNVVHPVFMPIFDSKTGALACYEALARTHSGYEHGPLLFTAEKYGFIHSIDVTMLDQVVTLMRLHPNVKMSVNVSVRTIEHDGADYLSAVYKHMDVISRIVFEITETVQISDMKQIRTFIEAVRVLGGRIAVDDFGSGYFSMSEIEAINPDFVKLSTDFVNEIEGRAGEILFLRDRVNGYRGGRIIAEHVDSLEKLVLLSRLGIELTQGYFWGKPLEYHFLPHVSQYADIYQELVSDGLFVLGNNEIYANNRVII